MDGDGCTVNMGFFMEYIWPHYINGSLVFLAAIVENPLPQKTKN